MSSPTNCSTSRASTGLRRRAVLRSLHQSRPCDVIWKSALRAGSFRLHRFDFRRWARIWSKPAPLPNLRSLPTWCVFSAQYREIRFCVLLRHDGQFHLGTSHGGRTKVSEGSLPSAEFLKVQRMLDGGGLPRLARVAEDDPCVRDTADQHLPHRPLAESSLHG
jgi:hypothetical protein